MSTDPEVLQRIAALEFKVEHLMRSLTGAVGSNAAVPPLPDQSSLVSPEVLALARSGETITAIKQYRDETGADLAVAKAVVESL